MVDEGIVTIFDCARAIVEDVMRDLHTLQTRIVTDSVELRDKRIDHGTGLAEAGGQDGNFRDFFHWTSPFSVWLWLETPNKKLK
jgi:hypothetical protein